MMNEEDVKSDGDLFDSSPKPQEEDDGDIWRSAVGESNSQTQSGNHDDYLNNPSDRSISSLKSDEQSNSSPSIPVPDSETTKLPESLPATTEKETPSPGPIPSPAVAPAPSQLNNAPAVVRVSAPVSSSGGSSGDGDLQITVVEPQKRGDGMGSYVVYKVVTTTTLPFFGGRHFEVFRRYSDFLGLYTKLRDKYAPYGRIVPPPPEKDFVGATSTKFAKDQSATNAEFVNRRRCALERFMQRLGANNLYRQDPDLRDFVTQSGDLPKASDTSALSAAGFKRFFNKVGSTVTGVVTPFDEPDPWFEERLEQISILENQLKKLVDAAEAMQICRHDAAQGLAQLGSALRLLANAEENNALSRAISQLAETAERAHEIRQVQSEADSLLFAEQVRDYVSWLVGVRGVFEERCKAYRRSKDLEIALNKKREAKARAELQSPAVPDKVQALNEECEQTNQQLERSKADCEKMSETLREEISRFENGRAKEFNKFATAYLERQADSQQQMIDLWTNLLPEVKNIPVA